MIKWGYCAISRIKTNAPSQLEISLTKTADYQKLHEAFEVTRAERAEAYKARKAAEAEKKALEKESKA